MSVRAHAVTVAAPPRPQRPAAAAAAARVRETLVVVGNGMVAHRFCRALVACGAKDRYAVTVCGEEATPAYDRVHLTDYLAGVAIDSLVMSPAEWYEEHGFELLLGERVVAIDRAARQVRTASGLALPYARLILATGSAPYVPPIEGANLPGVFSYRTLRDLELIRERALSSARAAVIGGGLLGLEAARALQHLGLEVSIVEMAGALMPTQLDQRASDVLAEEIKALGITVRTGTRTARIEAFGKTRRLRFANGDSEPADLVVIAAGVRPRGELAVHCGLATSADGGIVINDHLMTSDPRIYAIGECASHRARTHGLVAPGYAMADALASSLGGRRATFRGITPATRLKLLDVEVSSAGPVLDGGPSLVFERDGIYRRLQLRQGRLVAALGVGDWPESARVQTSVAKRLRVWPWQAARFEKTGQLWRQPLPEPSGDLPPANAIVCNCLGVTCGQISACSRQRGAGLESVVSTTGASTVCGSCRPLVERLVGVAARERSRIGWGLLVPSVLAAVVTGVIAQAQPVAFVNTVIGAPHLDVLWRESVNRQISGFTLVALCAAAALLGVRKRFPRLSLGSFGRWRIAHGVIGVLTLGALIVHTGMRLGSNLNLALVTVFLTANVIGAVAGGATGVDGRFGNRIGRAWRTGLVFAHVVAIWPLPVLLAFHILAVYYF